MQAAVRASLAAAAAVFLLGAAADRSNAAFPLTSTFVYLHSTGGTPQVHAYRLEANGSFTELAGSPYAEPDTPGSCANFCNAIAWVPSRNVLLTAGGTGITSWTVATDGTLTATPGSPYKFGIAQPATSVVGLARGSKTFAYATQYFGHDLDGFEVLADGSLAHLAGLPLRNITGASVLSGGGSKLVYCDEDNYRLRALKVSGKGKVKAGKPVAPKGNGSIYYVTVAPSGKFAYAGEWNAQGLFSFKISGKPGLAPAKNGKTTLSIANADAGVSLSSTGLAAVFANQGVDDVQMFTVPASGKTKGSLTALGGAQSSGLATVNVQTFSPDGQFLLAASATGSTLRSFDVNPTSGAISEAASVTVTGSVFNGLVSITR